MTSHQENYRSYCKVAQIYNCYQSDYPKQDLIKKVLRKEGDINFRIPSNSSVISSEPDLAGGTALHIAVMKNDVEIFDTLLDKGADITIQNQQGRTALHCIAEQSEVKKELLDIGFSTHLSLGDPSNPCDVNGISHFYIACMKDHVNAVEFLLNGGVPIDVAVNANSKKFAGFTGLHFAAENFALATIKVLLKHNASMNLKDVRGLTPFHLLLEQKIRMMDHINAPDHQQISDTLTVPEIDDALNMLLDINDIDELGLTHFHVACAMQDSSVAEYFLEQHINTDRAVKMDSPFRPGYTALHFAAHCNLNTAKMLLRKNANFEVRDANGLAPMDLFWRLGNRDDLLALLRQHWSFVKFSDKRTQLVDFVNFVWNHDALDQFIRSLDDIAITVSEVPTCWTGRTLLHFTVLLCRNVDTLVLLLNLGFAHHVDASDNSGATPIHLAFRANKLDFVEHLMSKTQTPKNLVDKDGLSYLHIACVLQKVDYVKKWSKHSKDRSHVCRGGYAHAWVKSGSTALHVAMASGNCQIINTLLERGIDVLIRDADGGTPIHRFLQLKVNAEDVCRILLLTRMVREIHLEHVGLTRLHLAVYWGDKYARSYVDTDNVNSVVYCNDQSSFMHPYDGCTPLQMAIKRRASSSVVESLLKLGADLLRINDRGESPLYAALSGTPDDEIESVIITTLQFNTPLRKKLEEMSGITILHLACHVLNKNAISWLLIGNVDTKARVKSECPVWPGYTPLHVLMKAVEQREAKDNFQDSFRLMMENEVDVAAVNADGETPIHLAFRNLSIEGMYQLLNQLFSNLRVFNVNPVSRDGISHFHAACLMNNAAAVKLFLENGVVDVNQPIDFFSKEYAGSTPLHLALENKIARDYGDKQNIVSWLLYCGADVKAEDSRGYTPLHVAVKVKGALSIVQELVRHGAKVDSRNIFEQTPLELLLQSESVSAEGIQFFENAGCCLNSSNPLSEEGYISMLISHRYHPYYKDAIRSRSMTAELQRFYPTLTRMESKNSRLQQFLPIQTMFDTIDSSLIDENGRSLIHNVMTTNDPNYELFDRLDRLVHTLCTDIDLLDKKGKTALHLAAQFGNNLAVEKLLDAGADINVIDARNQTALGYAMQYYDNKNYCPEQKCHMKVMLRLVAHLRSLERLNLEVSKLNRRLKADAMNIIPHDKCYGRDHIDAVALKKCTRSVKITNTDLHVGDFLSDTGKGLVSYPFMSDAKREKVDKFFHENCDTLKSVCILQYRKAVKRLQFVRLAVDSFWVIANMAVPIFCVEMIFQYLRNSELENIIKAANMEEKSYVEDFVDESDVIDEAMVVE